MLKAIQAELYKLFKNRTFKVLICVAVLLSTLTVVMCSSVFEKILNDSLGNMPQDQKEVLMEQLTSMSESEAIVTPGQLGIQLQAKDMMNPTSIEVYHASFGSGVIEIIIGILVGALIAKEYSQGTIKNFLAYGKRREEFYLAKFVSMVIAVTIILAVMTILPTIVVTLMNGWGKAFEISQLLGMIKTFVASVIAGSAVAALAMIIATLVKSNGATIGITVAIFIGIPTLAGFLYGIYPWFDRVYEVLPFYNSALATSIKAGNGDLLRSVIISLVTIAISLFVGIKIFKLEKNIKLGFGIVIFILGIISFIILPNKVGMQISVSGKLQNYMPKIIAVIIPIGLYGLGFLPNGNGKSAEIKRNIILSLLAIVIQIFTLVSNL